MPPLAWLGLQVVEDSPLHTAIICWHLACGAEDEAWVAYHHSMMAGVAPDDEMGNFDIAMDWAMGNFSVHQARSGSSIAALVLAAHPHVCARSSWIRTPVPSSATTTRYAANCGCTRA